MMSQRYHSLVLGVGMLSISALLACATGCSSQKTQERSHPDGMPPTEETEDPSAGEDASDDGASTADGSAQAKDAAPTDAHADGGDAAPEDAAQDTAQEAGPKETKAGSVDIVQVTVVRGSVTSRQYTVSALFQSSRETDACTTKSVAGCTVTVCSGSRYPDDMEPKSVSAGTLSVAGGSSPVELEFDASEAGYPLKTDTAMLFKGGETLTVRAQGGDVPAFSETLEAPAVVTIKAPTTDASDGLAVDTAAPPSFEWTGVKADFVVTLEVTDKATSKSYAAQCAFPGSNGRGAIPEGALSEFPKGSAKGSFMVESQAQKDITAGAYAVTLRAASPGVYEDGTLASGMATFR